MIYFQNSRKRKVSLFGVSAKYIDQLKLNLNIKSKYKLKNLKTICSTGYKKKEV